MKAARFTFKDIEVYLQGAAPSSLQEFWHRLKTAILANPERRLRYRIEGEGSELDLFGLNALITDLEYASTLSPAEQTRWFCNMPTDAVVALLVADGGLMGRTLAPYVDAMRQAMPTATG